MTGLNYFFIVIITSSFHVYCKSHKINSDFSKAPELLHRYNGLYVSKASDRIFPKAGISQEESRSFPEQSMQALWPNSHTTEENAILIQAI